MHPNDIIDTGVPLGYAAVNTMARAIEKAGKVESAAIRDALAQTDFAGLSGRTKFDKNGHSQPRCSITQIRNGVNTVVYQLTE